MIEAFIKLNIDYDLLLDDDPKISTGTAKGEWIVYFLRLSTPLQFEINILDNNCDSIARRLYSKGVLTPAQVAVIKKEVFKKPTTHDIQSSSGKLIRSII
ncbi:hypothetical protein [Calidifontibacillus erzurumensis]|uniref:hypothetical protein n=1 Tax=Calidifontibacillus erzurumensis TaxID=2741433 RepID=UPI0035B52F3F